jgi:hypothetical protein
MVTPNRTHGTINHVEQIAARRAAKRQAAAANATPLDPTERDLLLYISERNWRCAKRQINKAWASGDYRATLNLNEADAAILQRLRNTRGPSWLAGLSFAKLRSEKFRQQHPHRVTCPECGTVNHVAELAGTMTICYGCGKGFFVE